MCQSFRQINDDDDCSTGRSYIDAKLRKCWSIPPSDLSSSMISDQYYVINGDQSRPLISPLASVPVLAQPLDLLLADIWICLETAFGFVSQNIYISPGFNFPYFRSSPLSISPAAEWHHIFLLNCPEKKNHFWRGLQLKQMYEILFSRGAKIGSFFESVKPKWAFLLFLQNKGLCGNAHVRRQFWQSSWSLHLFTESTSGRKWTTGRRLAHQCPPW